MEMKRFLNATDVAKRMEISVPMAYKIIRRLNDELKEKGYLTVAGKVSRVFFEEKLYDTSAAS
jgi:ribosomal protein S25